MLRRLLLAVTAVLVGLGLSACDSESKNTNPDKLPYGNEAPPKREGAPGKRR
jgi:hypothetical protein